MGAGTIGFRDRIQTQYEVIRSRLDEDALVLFNDLMVFLNIPKNRPSLPPAGPPLSAAQTFNTRSFAWTLLIAGSASLSVGLFMHAVLKLVKVKKTPTPDAVTQM
jgi:hypothetical protein